MDFGLGKVQQFLKATTVGASLLAASANLGAETVKPEARPQGTGADGVNQAHRGRLLAQPVVNSNGAQIKDSQVFHIDDPRALTKLQQYMTNPHPRGVRNLVKAILNPDHDPKV